MSGHKLILIRDAGRSEGACAELVSATLAHLPATSRPTLIHHTVHELLNDPAPLDAPVAIGWIFTDNPDAGGVFEVIGLLQDRHLPVMLTRTGETELVGAMHQDGVVVCPPSADPLTLAAVLQSLRSQLPALRAMKNELKLLRRHQGSLGDQIGRIDEELRLAAQLQKEFLPKSMPTMGPVSFRVMFRPASYVSGDIYDVTRLDEEHLSFFIADAVGHGVPAALLTMFIKRALQTKKIDPTAARGYRILEPSEALGRLNRDLVETQGGQVRFATACYGVVNCNTRQLCVSRAGHPLPILLRGDGTTIKLEPEGGLLGVFPEEEYEQACVQLDDGDRLLLYSDGFEMAFGDPGDAIAATAGLKSKRRVATEQYVAEFEDLRHGSLDEALARLQEKLDSQAGSLNQRDDLTMVCLDVARQSQSAAVTRAA